MSPPVGEPPRCARGVCRCRLRRYSLRQLVEKHQSLQLRLNSLTNFYRDNLLVLTELNERLVEIEELLISFRFGDINLTEYEQVGLLERQHRYTELVSKHEEAVVLAEEGIVFLSYRMDWVMLHILLAWEEEQRRCDEEMWRLDQGLTCI